MKKKQCSTCKQVKPVTEFTKHTKEPDGLYYQCVSCKRAYQKTDKQKTVRKIYRETSSVYREYMERQSKDPKALMGRYLISRRFCLKNPIATRARDAVKYAVKTGSLANPIKCKCIKCEKPARYYHHTSGYSKINYLTVVPVCVKCHIAIHAKLTSSAPQRQEQCL